MRKLLFDRAAGQHGNAVRLLACLASWHARERSRWDHCARACRR